MAIDPDDDLQWWINEAHLLRRQLAAARRARQVEENCRDLAERKLSSARRWAATWKAAAVFHRVFHRSWKGLAIYCCQTDEAQENGRLQQELRSARRWARAWKQAAKLANGRVRLVFKTKLRDLKKEDE